MNNQNIARFIDAIPLLISALPLTIFLFIVINMTSIFVGLLIVYLRIKYGKVINGIFALLISYIRGTPLLIQLFIVYFGLPKLLLPLGITASRWNPIYFVIIAYVINISVFFSEIYRSAYLGD